VSSGGGVTRIILLALGIVIGAVPEGLLPTLAIGMRLTAKRMFAKNVLIKNLEVSFFLLFSAFSFSMLLFFHFRDFFFFS
jgi:magnesium-transporting ATPase (P-type)